VDAGATLARDLLGAAPTGPTRESLTDCLGALAGLDLGRCELQELDWPLGRAVVAVSDSFEASLAAAHAPAPVEPCCDYLAGLLAGVASAVAGHDVSCRETHCSAAGAPVCRFELAPATGPQPLANSPGAFLGQQLRLLEILFSRMPMGIAIFDRNLRLRRCNPTWAEYLRRYAPGLPVDVWPGLASEHYTSEMHQRIAAALADILAGHERRYEALRMAVDGVVSYWDVTASPLPDDGKVAGLVMVIVDATERVLARQEHEIRVAERTREIERRRQVAEGLRDILGILNSNRSLAEILDAILAQARKILGSDACSILRLQGEDRHLVISASIGLAADYVAAAAVPWGKGISGMAVARRQPAYECDLGQRLHASNPMAYTPAQRDQVARLVRDYRAMLSVPLVVRTEVVGALALYYRAPRTFDAEDVDLAASYADQVALAIENARLRASIPEAAASDERSRLARDLHDAVTQTLFSASLISDVLPRLLERNPEQAWHRLEDLRIQIRGALAEMRSLLLELHPASLIRSRLPDLLQQLAEASTGRTMAPVHLRLHGATSDLPQDVRVALYRIAQEALNNAARHAGATAVQIDLTYHVPSRLPGAARVSLQIGDDGRGFVPDEVAPGHLGLHTMRERAAGIGADLTIATKIGEGTRVVVAWPGMARKEKRT
jgi:PAS domain S-box-containing protein